MFLPLRYNSSGIEAVDIDAMYQYQFDAGWIVGIGSALWVLKYFLLQPVRTAWVLAAALCVCADKNKYRSE